MLKAPNLSAIEGVIHGFGQRTSVYPHPIRLVKQIHSDMVLHASGASSGSEEGDALVTRQPGLVAGVRTADCVPVLIADRVNHAVAAVHAGWRGSALNIVGAAVRELISSYGSRAEDLTAAIGPCIGPCCYEVGPDVAQQFQKHTGAVVPASERRAKLDLAQVNADQLREAGVADIWTAGICTYCTAEYYFSYRREREQAGRMMSFIGTTIPGT